MKIPKLILLVGCLCLTNFVYSQNNQSATTHQKIDVVSVYEKVVEEGYGTPRVFQKLANEYYFKNNHIEAKKWFEKLFDSKEITDETLMFRYKQTLVALKLDKKPNQYISLVGFDEN